MNPAQNVCLDDFFFFFFFFFFFMSKNILFQDDFNDVTKNNFPADTPYYIPVKSVKAQLSLSSILA